MSFRDITNSPGDALGRMIARLDEQVRALQAGRAGTISITGTSDHRELSNRTDDEAHDQYVLRSLATSAGDLLVATAAGTLTALPVGSDGDVLTADSGQPEGVSWQTPALTTPTTFPLDVAPSSPHAKDDEFPGTSLDAKWTNPISSGAGLDLTLSVLDGWLRLQPATTGSGSTGKRGPWGVRQVAPTGSFTVSARIADGGSLDADVTDDARVGIFVARTADTKAHILGHQTSVPRAANADGLPYSETAEWGAYDGVFDEFVATSYQTSSGTWYRIVWDTGTSTLSFYFSTDGVHWSKFASRAGQAQPDRIGIAIWGNAADIRADHQLACKWFRVTEP